MERNKADRFVTKIQLNNKIINCKEFQDLLSQFGQAEMHRLSYYFLIHKCYLGYWIVEKLYKIKNIREKVKEISY